MMTGTVANREDANRYCHSTMLYPLKMVMPTVSGLRTSVEISVRATVYSFHALMNTKISAVTIPGAATGRRMRIRADTLPQPLPVPFPEKWR